MTTDAAEDTRRGILETAKRHAEKGPEELLAFLNLNVTSMIDTLAGLKPAQLLFSPGNEEWDISQVVKHAASSTRMFAKVSISLGEGEVPGELDSEAVTDSPVTAGGAQEMLIEAVDILRGFLSGVSDDTDTELTFDKPFGPMTCMQFAALQVGHVAQHARQIGDIKKNEGFPAAA